MRQHSGKQTFPFYKVKHEREALQGGEEHRPASTQKLLHNPQLTSLALPHCFWFWSIPRNLDKTPPGKSHKQTQVLWHQTKQDAKRRKEGPEFYMTHTAPLGRLHVVFGHSWVKPFFLGLSQLLCDPASVEQLPPFQFA